MAQLNEQFLRMQKLAGIITEEQYSEKIEEVSISGIVSKFKDKVMNLPAFQKFIDNVVSKMTDEDIAKFKSKFNIAEAEGVPSLDDIMKKAVSLNPDSDNTEPIKEEIDQESAVGKIINLVRILTGVNIMSSGAILGVPLAILLAGALTPLAATAGILISFIASCIIYGIASKLLGRGDNDSFLENVKQLNENANELISFTESNLEGLKKYLQQHLIFPGLEDEEIEERQMEIDSITGMQEDSMEDGAVTPDGDGVEMGVSIKFAEDADEDFVGEDGDEPEYFKLGGREMAAVWYNI